MPSKTIKDFAYQIKDYMRSAEVVEGKNFAYSQENNAVIATIENGKSYKVRWTGSATVTLKKNSASGTEVTSGSTSPLSFTADSDFDLYFGSSADVTEIMVYDGASTDDTYEPYYVPVKDSMFKRSEQRVLGAKNLCDITKSAASASSITLSDTGFSATSTTGASFPYVRLDASHLTNGMEYIISFTVDSVSGNDTKRITLRNASNIVQQYVEITTAKAYEMKFTYVTNYRLDLFLGLIASTVDSDAITVSNVMIRLASDPDDTYSPYAMTNKELTDVIEATIDYSHTASSTTPSPNANRTHCYKQGNNCVFSFWITNLTISSGSWLEVCRLNIKPQKETIFIMGQDRISVYGRITTSGALEINTYQALSGGDIFGQCSFMAQ